MPDKHLEISFDLFVDFNAQVHFTLYCLFNRIDSLQNLRHCFHQLFAGDSSFLIFEFRQQFCGGHWLSHEISSDGLLRYAIVTENEKLKWYKVYEGLDRQFAL